MKTLLTKGGGGTNKALNIFAMSVLVLSMSFMGVFLAAPAAQAVPECFPCISFDGYSGCFENDECMPYENCGDGTTNGLEECDGIDGVGTHQMCDGECELVDLSYCGDGVYQYPNDEGTGGPSDDGYEDCDNGEGNKDDMQPIYGADEQSTFRAYCSTNCVYYEVPGMWCGDGEINGEEECESDSDCSSGDTCNGCVCECNSLITLYKVVCDDESYLPNWGGTESVDGEPTQITDSTAADYVASVNEEAQAEVCWLESDWYFQWQDASQGNPGNDVNDDSIWLANQVGPTISGAASFIRNSGDQLIIREVTQDGYVPFSGGEGDVSAEIYCNTHIQGYDNFAQLYDPDNGGDLDTSKDYYCVAFNAPVQETGNLTVCKQNDLNGNGKLDNEEPVVQGWTFDINQELYTDGEGEDELDGCVTLEDVPYGIYTIMEVEQEGWSLTGVDGNFSDFSEGIATAEVGESNDNPIVYFLNEEIPTGSISGCKYNDTDGDGDTGDEDSTLDGWEIQLWQCPFLLKQESSIEPQMTLLDDPIVGECVLAESTVTEEGCYSFDGLLYGSQYRVMEVLQPGWIQTNPIDPEYYDVYVEDDVVGIDFYNHSEGPACECESDNDCESGYYCSDCECIYEGGGPVCGNDVIESGEQCESDDDCKDNQYCDSECSCETFKTGPKCGNGVCESGEDSESCCDDCGGCGGGPSCIVLGTCGSGPTPTPTPSSNPTPTVLGEEGAPKLVVNKSVSQEMANPGDKDIEFTVNVTNEGNLTAFSVTLSDVIPQGLTFADSGLTTKDWTLGDIAPGETKTVKYMVDVADFAQPLIYANIATAVASNYDAVKAQADLQVEAVEVLAETGFSGSEFSLLLMSAMTMIGGALILRRKYTI